MATIAIRPYQPLDRDQAIDLFLELNRYENAISGEALTDRATAIVGQEEAEAMVRDIGAVLVVADCSGQLAGMMLWYPAVDESYVAESIRRYGKVDALVVASADRGKGIGRMLLAEAERLTRAHGLTRMKLSLIEGNDGAHAAYLDFGFRPSALTMVKDLA